MIINLDRIKLLAVIAAIIIIPIVGINLINKSWDESPVISNESVFEPDQNAASVMNTADITEIKNRNIIAEYRLERKRLRSQELALLKDIVNQADSSALARETAYIKLIEMAERDEKELQAETLIKSQGYRDCAVAITSTGTSVIFDGYQPDMAEMEELIQSVSRATGHDKRSISVLKINGFK